MAGMICKYFDFHFHFLMLSEKKANIKKNFGKNGRCPGAI